MAKKQVTAERPSVPRGDINGIELAGLNALGPLETSIMHIIWARKDEVTVKDIHMALFAKTGSFLAYTTVMATMSRLADKGLLRREKAPTEQAYLYTIAKTEEEYLYELGRRLIEAGAELSPRALEKIAQTRLGVRPDSPED